MASHSYIGASSCNRFWNCPGSVALISTLPEGKSTIYAAEGTVAHKLSEEALKNKKSIKEIKADIGKVIEEEGFKIKITEEMVEAVIFYVFLVVVEQRLSNSGELLIENQFTLPDIDEDARGTNDACILEHFGKLTIYDLKYGKGIKVSAFENKQLLYYALGAYDLGDFTEIELVIVQPRLEPDERASRFIINHKDLDEFRRELKTRVLETKNPKAKVEQGSWCKFCPATIICPAHKDALAKCVVDDFDDIYEPGLKVKPLEIEKLGIVLNNIEKIKSWVKEVESYALKQALDGKDIPGYKLVKSWGHKAWNPGLDKDLISKYGTDKVLKPTELLSPSKLEKIVGKEFVEKNTFKPDRGLVLVENSDKRDKWEGGSLESIAADFEEIE